MNCTHCGKRLSRKTARQIDGVVMCGNCMFRPPARDSGSGPAGLRREPAQGEAPQSGDSRIAQTPSEDTPS
jgi:predicted  nucleic acid-binding Zn-ribbon protein